MAGKSDARYTKHAIKSGSFSTEELIGEYERLRRIKNRRLQRLEEKYPRAQVVKESSPTPSIQNLTDEKGELDMSKVSSEMSDAYKFTKTKSTTITGFEKQLKRSIKSFNNLFPKGENPINENNVWDLFDFLADYRNKYQTQKIRNSDEVIDVWVQAYNTLNMNMDSLLNNIDYWAEHYREMRSLEPARDEEGNLLKNVSSDWYKEQLEKGNKS